MKPTKKDKDFDKLRKPIKVCQKEKRKKENQSKEANRLIQMKWEREPYCCSKYKKSGEQKEHGFQSHL